MCKIVYFVLEFFKFEKKNKILYSIHAQDVNNWMNETVGIMVVWNKLVYEL